MPKRRYNPEQRAWRGRSYKRAGKQVSDLNQEDELSAEDQQDYIADLKYDELRDKELDKPKI